jgi:carnosine N-methyltransferase
MTWTQREIAEFSDLISALSNYRAVASSHLEKLATTGLRSPDEMSQLSAAINSNADLFEYMARKAPSCFGLKSSFSFPVTRSEAEFDSSDLHQLTSALRSAARDWTSLGDAERSQTYKPLVAVLHEYLPPDAVICVPGAGLCRLAIEIASSGFVSCANENSFVMIVISRIAMKHKRSFRIFPFCHQLSGLDSVEDSLVSAVFPDAIVRDSGEEEGIVEPFELLGAGRLVLLAGGFEGMQDTCQERYDAVVTSFFIDVVEDIAAVVGIIYQILKPGGFWVNLGPMMLHHGDDDFFSTATLEDLTRISRTVGFQVLREDRIETTYIANPRGHIRTLYNCKLLVTRK